MRNILLLTPPLLAAAMLTITARGDSAVQGEEIQAQLNELVDRGLNRAIVVGIVTPEGRKYYSQGTFREGDTRTVNSRTVFELGAVTELFTGLLYADMLAKDEVHADDPVEDFLPKTVQVPDFEGTKITLNHLATHTSGLPGMPDNLKPTDKLSPLSGYSNERLYDFLKKTTLKQAPGSTMIHSTVGFGLLGHVLELKAGSDYETLVRTRICEPLEMKSTSIALNEIQRYHLARPHYGEDQVPFWDVEALRGAIALRSNARDMLAFLGAQLDLVESNLHPSMLLTHDPLAKGHTEGLSMGMGWLIFQDGIDTFHIRSGKTGGHAVFAGLNQNRKIGVVVFSNTAYSVDNIGFHVLSPERVPLNKYRDRIEITTLDARRFEGAYRFSNNTQILISRREDRIYARTQSIGNQMLWPIEENTFYHPITDAVITFHKNANGVVTELVLKQGEEELKAEKVNI